MPNGLGRIKVHGRLSFQRTVDQERMMNEVLWHEGDSAEKAVHQAGRPPRRDAIRVCVERFGRTNKRVGLSESMPRFAASLQRTVFVRAALSCRVSTYEMA